MQLRTKRNYGFFECSSAMQKAIRRNLPKIAGYFAIEMFKSGYMEYVWKRLMIIGAEDCAGIINVEIMALYEGYKKANTPKPEEVKGAIFVAKAILLMCQAIKNRDADTMVCIIHNDMNGIAEQEIETALREFDESEYQPIPGFAHDVHTSKGRRSGKTRADFFTDELKALTPKQPGLFDNLIP
jgi:replication-associated recombination protein RarA